MPTTTVRIREDLARLVQTEASRLGVTFQEIVNGIVERELTVYRRLGGRPIVEPVALSPLGAELERSRGRRIVLVFDDAAGWPWLLAGVVAEARPTEVDIEVWQARRALTIPRGRITSWRIAKDEADFAGDVERAVILWRNYGVNLHPLVQIGGGAEPRD